MLSLPLLIALAQPPNVPPDAAEPMAVSRHTVLVHGRRLAYTATAGRLPILDNETGEVRARIFFVAYTVAGGSPDRPVTFAWNGGPGSSAGLIQLGGLGPKRYAGDTLVDNQETWLDRTDLVFVDPVGTGFSRVTRREYAPDFLQTRGDAESVAEFIRVYRGRFERWSAPVYLAGESFGVIRAAGVAEALVRRRMAPNGVVLIGLKAPLDHVPDEIRDALRVTGYAAAAWHHRRLGAAVQSDFDRMMTATTRFSLDTLAPALAAKNGGPAERARLALAMAPYIGTMPGPADTTDQVLSFHRFARLLLADRGLRLGHYDTRLTGPMDGADQPYDPTDDPSLQGPPPPNGVVRYLIRDLGYRSDLQYTGPFGGVYPPSASLRGDWMSVRWRWEPDEEADSARLAAADLPLRRALAAVPGLKVFVACGYYDLLCNPAVNAWIRDRLPSNVRERVAVAAYHGGHATYLDRDARIRIKADVFRFFGLSAGPAPR